MGFVELTDGPEELRARGTQFGVVASGAAARMVTLLQKIDGLQNAHPEGNDEYGEAFRAQYGQSTEDGPLNIAADGQVHDLGQDATQLSDGLSYGGTMYQIQDIHDTRAIGGIEVPLVDV